MLDREANPHDLRRLAEIGVLDGPMLSRALARVGARGDRRVWHLFAERALLFLGLGLIVAAVVFFFAANWGAMTRGARLGLALAAHVVTALVAARFGTQSTTGRAAAAGAALLIGPALLTYGQAYQTGADAWQLFAAWTALAIPFALVARGTAIWVVVLVLARVSAFLFADQHHIPGSHGEGMYAAAFASLLLDAGAYAFARRRPTPWLGTGVVALAIATVALPLAAIIVDAHALDVWSGLLLAAAVGAHMAGLADAMRRNDLPRAALWSLSTALHFGVGAARVLVRNHELDRAGLLWMSVFVLTMGSAIAWLLHRMWAHKREVRA